MSKAQLVVGVFLLGAIIFTCKVFIVFVCLRALDIIPDYSLVGFVAATGLVMVFGKE